MERTLIKFMRIWRKISHKSRCKRDSESTSLYKGGIHMNGLTYTKVGDYYLPNLVLKEQPDTPIGRYGRMKLRYLKDTGKGCIPACS